MLNAELSCAHDEGHVIGCSVCVDCTGQGMRARLLLLCKLEGARDIPLLSMKRTPKFGVV